MSEIPNLCPTAPFSYFADNYISQYYEMSLIEPPLPRHRRLIDRPLIRNMEHPFLSLEGAAKFFSSTAIL